MTANHDIGLEANRVFHALCLGQTVEHTEHLLVAPKCQEQAGGHDRRTDRPGKGR
ncbi:MAG: hypothetical protein ACLUOF_12435 [Ruminococcus sp.]